MATSSRTEIYYFGRANTIFPTAKRKVKAKAETDRSGREKGGGDARVGQQVTLPEGVADKVIAMAMGHHHAMFVSADGQVWVTAMVNESGQAGLGHNESVVFPCPITLPEKAVVASVACGGRHSCLVTSAGKLFTFGGNSYGQLGTGDLINRNAPTLVQVPGCFVKDVSAGDTFTLCRAQRSADADAPGMVSLYSFGNNSRCRLGLGDESDRCTPTLVRFPEYEDTPSASHSQTNDVAAIRRFACMGTAEFCDVERISCGSQHCAVASKSALYTWGMNGNGRLATNSDAMDGSSRPKKVFTLSRTHITGLSCSEKSTLLVDSAGRLFAFGRAAQCKRARKRGRTGSSPVEVFLDASVRLASAQGGNGHFLALDSKSRLFSWGENDFGQSCHEEYLHRKAPLAVSFRQLQHLHTEVTAQAMTEDHEVRATVDEHSEDTESDVDSDSDSDSESNASIDESDAAKLEDSIKLCSNLCKVDEIACFSEGTLVRLRLEFLPNPVGKERGTLRAEVDRTPSSSATFQLSGVKHFENVLEAERSSVLKEQDVALIRARVRAERRF